MILAPAKTPRAVMDRLVTELGAALKDADVRAQLSNLALVVEPSTPQEVTVMMREVDRAWMEFFRETDALPK